MSTASIYKLLQEKLVELKSLEIAERHYKTTKNALVEAEKKDRKIRKQLKKENADVEKLERMGLKKLFHKILGDSEKQLETERQEFLELSLKHNEHIKSIELMEFELEVLDKKRKNISTVKKQLATLKKRREQELISSNSAKGKKLRKIIEEADYLTLGKKEYYEAIVVGKDIIKHLKTAMQYLRKAENWGTYKNMGGGRMSSYNQRGSIENAKTIIIRTQHLMRIFQKELQDINVHDFDTRINADQLSGFTNIFFDNLITDWIIQKKIRNTLSEIRSTHDRIKRFLAYLESEELKMQKKLAILNDEREMIITNK